jgi:hypothetical protein
MKFTWSGFFKTLLVTAIGGAASGITHASVTPGAPLKSVGIAAGAGALSTSLAYIFQSPFFVNLSALGTTPPPADPAAK